MDISQNSSPPKITQKLQQHLCPLVKNVCQQSEDYGVRQYLLVWNSADTTRKGRFLLVIPVELDKTPGSLDR
jgi:hypothetical protein